VTSRIKKWFLESISRQVSLLLVILLSTVLLLPAFYFYNTQKKELNNTVEQLATQLIHSLKTSISRSLQYKDNYRAWQLIKNELKNNQRHIKNGGFLRISEIAILDNNNLVFAHNSPTDYPLHKKYTGKIPDIENLLSGINILTTYPDSKTDSYIRLYSNIIYQGNINGKIIIQADLSLLDAINNNLISNFITYFVGIILFVFITGLAFGNWISGPIRLIEESITKIGSGRLSLNKLHNRHDEYNKLALAIENIDKELHESHNKIDLLLDSTAEAIYGIDNQGNCTFVNQACLSMLRFNDKSQLIGQNMASALHKKQNSNNKDNTLYLESKRHVEDEVIWRNDNTSFPAEYWSHPVISEGKCIGAVVTFLDITDRKKALNSLKAREQDLSTMLHSIGDAVIATDENGLITRMNPVAEKLTGWTFNDAYGEKVKNIFPIIDATTRIPIENPIDKVMNSGEIVYLSNHTTLISKNGKEFHIADSAAPIRNPHNEIQGMILVFNDVTEQYILRSEINEQRTRLQRIFDDMQSLVCILDTDGTLTFINNTPLKLGNLKEHEVLGLKLWNLDFYNYDKKVQQSVKNDCIKAANGSITFNDIALKTPDGLFWIEFSVHPVTNDVGDIIQLVAEGRDINKRKEQEKILQRSQKMDAIGKLAGGIAHDFNNQLGVVIGYLDILQSTLTDEKQLMWIDRSTSATLRCIDLTRQLLTFSRNKSTEKMTTDLNSTLKDLQTMVTRTVTPEVEVEYNLDENLWLIDINTGDLQDAILNLVINARDVMPNGGKLTFETSNKKLDSDFANNQLNIEAGDYIQLMISDTGCGMDNNILEKIFEPFFTTKEEGKGTGLGLAMVYSFVKRFDGGIIFNSEVGAGTTVRIYLPRSTTTTSSESQKTISKDTSGGTETILIVDDERDLLELASKYLSDLGYEIKKAENAYKALEILENDSSIDLLFSDVVMPGGMSGYELADQALTKWPSVKILLTSGFTSRVRNSKEPHRFDRNLLSKPYRKSELAKNIRLTLDEISQ